MCMKFMLRMDGNRWAQKVTVLIYNTVCPTWNGERKYGKTVSWNNRLYTIKTTFGIVPSSSESTLMNSMIKILNKWKQSCLFQREKMMNIYSSSIIRLTLMKIVQESVVSSCSSQLWDKQDGAKRNGWGRCKEVQNLGKVFQSRNLFKVSQGWNLWNETFMLA